VDRVARYREIVRQLIEEYASIPAAFGDIQTEPVIDPVRDHYEVVNVGWVGHERVHGTSIHIDIIGGKIWIQYNGTDAPIADELVQAGIPREDIVLAFHPPHLRQYTEFAVG
jgi:hypothetical protein